jgi:predicted kinase
MATVHLIFGRVGAGKTTYARSFAATQEAVFFCLDEWMAKLFTMDAPQPLTLEWMLPRVHRAEAMIWTVAQQLLDLDIDVVLELGFFTRAQRDGIRARVAESGVPILPHVVDAPAEVRLERVRARNAGGATYTIEVDDATFRWAESYFEPLGDDEVAGAVIVDTR